METAIVRCGNLLDNPQSQPVTQAKPLIRTLSIRGLLLQHGLRILRQSDSIVRHRQYQLAFRYRQRKTDCIPLWILPHAVLHKVIDGPRDQPGIPLQHGIFGIGRNRNPDLVTIGNAAVQQIRCIRAKQPGHAHRFPVDWLHLIFQLRNQIEILHQFPDLDALVPHNLRLFPYLPACIFVLRDAGCIAHDHGKRCADVVGNAADPVGPRLILPAQNPGGPVDALRNAGQFPFHGQIDGCSAGKCLNRRNDGLCALYDFSF